MTRTFKALIALSVVVLLAFVFAGSTGASEEPQIVRVTLKEYQIGVSQFIIVPDRPVTLVLANVGDVAHHVIVQSYADGSAPNVVDSPVIGSHTSQTIRFTLAPGIYRIVCDRWDHAGRGMVNVVAAENPRATTTPLRVDFIIPLLTLVLGSAYIIGDSLGLRLTR